MGGAKEWNNTELSREKKQCEDWRFPRSADRPTNPGVWLPREWQRASPSSATVLSEPSLAAHQSSPSWWYCRIQSVTCILILDGLEGCTYWLCLQAPGSFQVIMCTPLSWILRAAACSPCTSVYPACVVHVRLTYIDFFLCALALTAFCLPSLVFVGFSQTSSLINQQSPLTSLNPFTKSQGY